MARQGYTYIPHFYETMAIRRASIHSMTLALLSVALLLPRQCCGLASQKNSGLFSKIPIPFGKQAHQKEPPTFLEQLNLESSTEPRTFQFQPAQIPDLLTAALPVSWLVLFFVRRSVRVGSIWPTYRQDGCLCQPNLYGWWNLWLSMNIAESYTFALKKSIQLLFKINGNSL